MSIFKLPDYSEIVKSIEKNGFVFYENILKENDFQNLRIFWIRYFRNIIKNTPSSKNVFGAAQRLGDKSFSSFQNNNKTYMYRFKNYMWDDPVHELTVEITKKLHEVRNFAMGLPNDHGFNYNSKREAFFTQINLYPKDGGFLLPHTDGRSKNVMLNCMFSLTFKNQDFNKGGLYVILNNKKIDLDSLAKPNSVLFFDGNLTHGVDPVFSDYDDNESLGRLAVFPMIQYFLNSSTIPSYIRFLMQADISLKRRLGFKNKIKEGNSQVIDN